LHLSDDCHQPVGEGRPLGQSRPVRGFREAQTIWSEIVAFARTGSYTSAQAVERPHPFFSSHACASPCAQNSGRTGLSGVRAFLLCTKKEVRTWPTSSRRCVRAWSSARRTA